MKRILSFVLSIILVISMTAVDVPAATDPVWGPAVEETGDEAPAYEAEGSYEEEIPEEAFEEADEGDYERLGDSETYTVNFDANNGTSEVRSQQFIIGKPQQLNPNKFTKTGYSFASWNRDIDGQADSYTNNQMIDAPLGPAGSTVTLYAQWAPNVYTVSFNANGGKCTKLTMEVTYDQSYGILPTPTKDNYTFEGWYTAPVDGVRITESTKVQITDDQELFAHWSGNVYTVKFDAQGGECDTPMKNVTYDQFYGTLPEPTRDNYEFLGWFTEAVYGEKVTAEDKVKITKDWTLYAHWNGKQIRVDLDAGEGTVSPAYKIVTYGGVYQTLPTPLRTGYRFVGWYDSATSTQMITYSTPVTKLNDHTLYARWKEITHVITFKPNGGSCNTTTKTVTQGKPYGALPTPTNTGYRFLGWFTGPVNGTEIKADTIVDLQTDQILYAQWTGLKPTVTFNAGGGTVTPESIQVTYAQRYGTLPTPVRPGYSFLGWYTEEGGNTKVTPSTEVRFTEDQTLYAKWSARQYTIRFNGNGGTSSLSAMRVLFGSNFGALPEAERDNYTFAGWYTDDDVLVEEGDAVSTDNIHTNNDEQTYYAHWNANFSTVTFDPNGGDPITPPEKATKTVEYLKKYGELPTPNKDNYDFLGWFTEAEGGTEITENDTVEIGSDQTLYAHWKGQTFEIRFEGCGGTPGSSQRNVVFNEKYGALPSVSRSGYTFEGWFTETVDGTKIESDTIVSEANLDTTAAEHKLYAHWTANTYTVTFQPNGGNCDTISIEVTYYEEYGELPEAFQTGSDFDGWYTHITEGTRVTPTTIVTTASDHSLYAHWLGQPYDVTFDPTGGDLPDSERHQTVYFQQKYGPLPEPTMEGHDFIGWYTDTTGSTRITEDTKCTVADDHTLYAKWTVKSCKISFIANGGNWNGYTKRDLRRTWDTVFDVKDAIAPKYKRHAFTGWYDDADCTIPHDFSLPVRDNQLIYAGWVETHLTGFAVTNLDAAYAYTGKAIKPDVEVYDYDYDDEFPLKPKVDYTVSYSSNTTNVGTASLTVSGKGNYTDKITRTYDIVARDISDPGPYADEFRADDIYVAYSAKAQKPKVTLYWNNKAMKLNKEYKLEWVNEKGDINGACKASGTYTVTITGVGNFNGTRTIDFVILDQTEYLMSTAWVSVANRYYDGTPARPEVKVKVGGKFLEDTDYHIIWPADEDMTDAGPVTITLVGDGNYVGTRTAKYQILGKTLNASWIMGLSASYPYSGGEHIPLGDPKIDTDLGTASVWTPEGKKLEKGKDYTVQYTKDTVSVGTVTMTVKGKGEYCGTVTKTFKVVPAAINSFTCRTWSGKVNYEKGGNCPKLLDIRFNGCLVNEERDYKVVYRNNTKPGEGTIIFTGQGNFKGKWTVPFEIERQNISDASAVEITVPDVAYVAKGGAYDVTPVLQDRRTGEILTTKDYQSKFRYTYKYRTEVMQGSGASAVKIVRLAGNEINKADIIPVGATLCVEITGNGGYTGIAKKDYRIVSRSLTREKVKVRDQVFTGLPVQVTKDDIIFVGGGNGPIPTKDDYEIIGYSRNINKGNAIVILKGKGTFGGIKQATFKIVQRPFQ
ncbi:MAG: InlB B-repeat-containing protein [Lachnospiraceae bacterium]|nr:InlB B-repeat-containing protein [Lachnospiraceae bacterium]